MPLALLMSFVLGVKPAYLVVGTESPHLSGRCSGRTTSFLRLDATRGGRGANRRPQRQRRPRGAFSVERVGAGASQSQPVRVVSVGYLVLALRGVERHPSAGLRRDLATALRLDELAVVLHGLSARGRRRDAGEDRRRDLELDDVGGPVDSTGTETFYGASVTLNVAPPLTGMVSKLMAVRSALN